MGRTNVDDPDTQFAGDGFGGQIGSAVWAQRSGANCIVEVQHGPSLAPAGGEGTGPLALPFEVLRRSRSVFC
jgi:hypothetical protein